MDNYDVFIIGTGTAGKLVANQCRQAGLTVGIVDNRDYGGTCSQRGCDPKKLLLASSEAAQFARDMTGDGVQGEIAINWPDAYNYTKRYTQDIPDKTAQSLKEAGVNCYHGNGAFIDDKTYQLEDVQITATHFVIASGMMTRSLEIPGESHLLTSDDFFTMRDLPKKIVFIGGGYIGMEFSHMMARAGVQVTVIERSAQILSPFDAFVANHLQGASIQLGIDIKCNAHVAAVEAIDGRIIVYYQQDGVQHQITTDVAYNTAGRIPSTKALNLEQAQVVTNDTGGVVVNDYLQSTSNSRFYACGDVSSANLPLTPLSGLEGGIVAQNIINGPTKVPNVIIPSVTFTLPQVASIGLTEEQARQKEIDLKIHQGDASKWFNVMRVNGNVYAYKIITDTSNDMVIGAHIISKEAGETINLFSVAMNHDIPFTKLKNTVFTYPSWANDISSF